MIWRDTLSPTPVPRRFVVKNGTKIVAPFGTLAIVFRFEPDEEGGLIGYLGSGRTRHPYREHPFRSGSAPLPSTRPR